MASPISAPTRRQFADCRLNEEIAVIPRSNSFSGSSESESKFEQANSPWTTWTEVVNNSLTTHSVHREFSGYDIPNFHARKKRGDLLPLTPFEQLEWEWSCPGGLYVYQNNASLRRYRRLNWYPSSQSATHKDALDISLTQMRNIASVYDTRMLVQASAAKIYSQGFDALTFFAELPLAIAMFKNVGERWREFLRRTALLKSWSSPRQFWLENRYGWRILVLEMRELGSLLANLSDERQRFVERSGSNDFVVESSSPDLSSSDLQIDSSIIKSFEVSLRGTVAADASVPKFQFNPLTTSWEVMRFSFIIDWFLSVGSFLESLSFLAITSQYVAAGGIRVSGTVTSVVTNIQAKTGKTLIEAEIPGPAVTTVDYVVRSPQSLPFRPFGQLNLNVYKYIDLIALISQAASRMR